MNNHQTNSDTVSEEEEIEGLDDSSGMGWGDYPLDSVFVRQETRTVGVVLDRVNKERYVLDPDFQREFIWPVDKQSKLIESCIMRIPLPVFYVAEAQDGRIIIVDGLQRITTFSRYVADKFRLRGIGSPEDGAPAHSLDGKVFSELALNLQERILDTQLIMYILDAKAPERARLDIFERVNSGVALTRQQMRNAIYNGPATKWLSKAAKSSLFLNVSGGSLNPKTMRDREAINRFCGFMLLDMSEYRGDMDVFLAATLKKMNSLGDADRKQLREAFDRALRSNKNLFGAHAFRKSLGSDDPHASRSVINISLFEVCMVLLARPAAELKIDSALGRQVQQTFVELVNDDEFSLAITYSTNSTRSVRARFELAKEALGIAEAK